jgi:hypothetical protein
LYLVNQENGSEHSTLPGLIAITPPRKAARGRESDTLIVLVSINGAAGITGDSLNNWAYKKAETFYQTAGTVTFAMKTLVESMNHDLLERNLRRAKDGARLSAALSLVVLRRESLYLVNVGQAHSFFANAAESLEFFDAETQTRGLGVDQMLTCRFNQKEIQENDVLVISCQPPEIWKAETFSGCASLATEVVGRRLFNQVNGNLKATLIRFKPGKGVITQTPLQNRPSSKIFIDKYPLVEPGRENAVSPVQPQTTSQPIQSQTTTFGSTPLVKPVILEKAETLVDPGSNDITRTGLSTEQGILSRPSGRISRPAAEEEEKSTAISPVKVKAGKITKKVVTGVNQTSSAFSTFLQKILPGMSEEPLKLSRGALIAIAILVPLVIVLFAAMIYKKAGASKEFDQYLVQAQQYSMQAEVQLNDPALKLASLQQSIYWLDKAEAYSQSDASTSLRVKVQDELDVMEGIQRLEMAEVIPGGLSAGSDITQIVATATDLYLLESTSGTVKHYSMAGSGYENDDAFDCGPNPKNQLNMMGKVVDMVPINVNNQFKATLLAVDASGNIEFCIPGDAGVTSSLTPPDQGWKQLKSISFDNDYLYILDSGGNAVYRYETKNNGVQIDAKPTLFFDNQIPSLTGAIDIEVNGDELYILRSNGQMVECTYGHMKDYKLTECQDPAPYGDMRTGQTPSAISFPEANFTQMRMTGAPDSSIYLLDTTSKALYHFSLQRNLQKILHPRLMNGLDIDRLTPTAIAVSSGRIAFMAFGNQIYYAPLP